jgi:hypothetical protein
VSVVLGLTQNLQTKLLHEEYRITGRDVSEEPDTWFAMLRRPSRLSSVPTV